MRSDENNPLATCHLTSGRPGLLTGDATFEVRGTFPVTLERGDRDSKGQSYARLRVGTSVGECILVPVDIDTGDPAHWHGYVRVEGYEMRFRGVPTDQGMRAEFHNCVQRVAV